MIKKLSFIDLYRALKETIEKHTDYRVIDDIQLNEQSPFYYVEILEKRDTSTKTMFRETVVISLHAIAEPSGSKEQVYDMVQALEEAMTIELQIPGVDILDQRQNGVYRFNLDETNEWHGIIDYEIRISYGFKTKI
ncbi:hypothetical protein HMPREF2626_01605 [Aerococcus sp. HMSC062A02]|uniref:DUF5072 family protein n=1 Tax=Aerococcus sp. HMSC062A02 TaxID=1715105 RepID=UPI0008A1817D|nr:DUF5072 family protein [Aerococcus sp. HMSC062A02]OFN02633.1 hypothetical protein HMPREF2626_01605 [Aerococcus sp. HMSC062A02]